MMDKKNGNPAVVGLAGFGLTTLLLQLHNLGLCSIGPVFAMGIIFGGLAQFIAGFQEQKMGNNFGYSAFVSYGAFWIGLCIIWITGHFKIYESTTTDVGYYLLAWALYTGLMFMGSLRIHKAMVVTFGLLLSGFVLLVLGHFGDATFNTVAAYVLIGCAFSAWYMMIGIIINDLAGKVVIPMGAPFIK
ncbi:MAG: acetate uptake transporter [Saprospiraceae bacterium]|nr:acetate uptake transporter [Saprospiraceae bacterium]MBK6566386.1 acetate uptake transporter [Saprospiraceae bacterium]MBK6783397.1 acetate uptake transporter [Saprospiraceae bacterium]MBK7524309.1 acetate uptake transporter [Saprospiraceae bacterium]MBK8372770.1 acetate uptake transporter [Saprospiraceae bacterium]